LASCQSQNGDADRKAKSEIREIREIRVKTSAFFAFFAVKIRVKPLFVYMNYIEVQVWLFSFCPGSVENCFFRNPPLLFPPRGVV
jgi:hypothetical protein